ncbi:MAG: hypothetical protein D6731_14385 [Planctomycetota bacterium]|nr:MAG: hypothetical protein D6731_14385 [Planctomycetota bacterium]
MRRAHAPLRAQPAARGDRTLERTPAWREAARGLLEATAFGLEVAALGVCLLTALTMAVLGPFGVFPLVFLLLPLLVASWLSEGCAAWLDGGRNGSSPPASTLEDEAAVEQEGLPLVAA